jgi:hypothetical protein
MHMLKRFLVAAGVAAAFALTAPVAVTPAAAKAVVLVHPRHAPPRLRVEHRGHRPHAGWVWRSGYWRWHGGKYAWVGGLWVAPPHGMHVWVAGHWRTRHGYYIWVPGHWRR